MKTLQDIKAELEAILVDLQAIIDAPVVAPVETTVTEVDVKESDGSDEKFVPETPEVTPTA